MADVYQPLGGTPAPIAAPAMADVSQTIKPDDNVSASFASDAKGPSDTQKGLTGAASGFGSALMQQHHAEFGALFGHGPSQAPPAAPVPIAAPAPAAPTMAAPPPMIQAPQMQAMSDRRTKTAIAPADTSLADFLSHFGGR